MAPKDDVEAKPACHPRACAIQDCLTRNGYNEAKCQTAIKALYECCEAFYERYGDEGSTPSCPKPNLLRLKMKQLREEK
ncbi:mature-T-cell-proliferation protein [Thelonectria olida]|uniref:Cx9C motif-containing protein 4, mitochondrial n=1 Tax=Thelonectria olida TaxID=1576542 RepID=A0A9P8W9S1_9HYPO|nr:mature-T-cell-proliferation protein [Thelonectria olida]